MKNYLRKIQQWIFTHPFLLIRFGTFLVCSAVVVYQVAECVSKLLYPPTATLSRFHINETMFMPAVTICQKPPYNADILKKYGFDMHIMFGELWNNFNFSDGNVMRMLEEATFNQSSLEQSCLNSCRSKISVSSAFHLASGQCHTFRPVEDYPNVGTVSGYYIEIKHYLNENVLYDFYPGWNIYIHERKDNFSEIDMKMSGNVECFFANIGEEISLKIEAIHVKTLVSNNLGCSDDSAYSMSVCFEQCIWHFVSNCAKCRGPWMSGINLPTCNNSEGMKTLIDLYNKLYYGDIVLEQCNCKRSCRTTLYSAQVVSRQGNKQSLLTTQLNIYYASKIVTFIEEVPGYDLSQFIADLGGSLGFLLGLSVLGILKLLQKALLYGKKAYLKHSNKNTNEI